MKLISITLAELLKIHTVLIRETGGSDGVRDQVLLESALTLPYATFGGEELYTSIAEKTAAMGYSLLKNHGFIDGNKRIAVAAMDVFLLTNGYSLNIATDDAERMILDAAASVVSREQFSAWVQAHIVLLG
jgi:death on curing protein